MSQLFPSGGRSIGASASAISPSNSGLIALRIDWFDLLAVQRTSLNLFLIPFDLLANIGYDQESGFCSHTAFPGLHGSHNSAR